MPLELGNFRGLCLPTDTFPQDPPLAPKQRDHYRCHEALGDPNALCVRPDKLRVHIPRACGDAAARQCHGLCPDPTQECVTDAAGQCRCL